MGQKYAVFNSEGFPTAFYDSEIHTQIPQDTVAITDEQWLEFISNQGLRKWNFQNNQVEIFDQQSIITFDEKKAQIIAQIGLITSQLLQSTDYIVLKIGEVLVDGQDIKIMTTQYEKQLEYRKLVRTWVANTKAAITAATTMQELEAIDLTNYPQES